MYSREVADQRKSGRRDGDVLLLGNVLGKRVAVVAL